MKMSYGGTTPSQDKKIDGCLSKMKDSNFTRSEKVAVCKAKTLKSDLVEYKGEWYYVSLAESTLCESLVVRATQLSESEFILDDEDGVCESSLSYQQRKDLADSDFCLVYKDKGKSGSSIKRRRFPAHDKAHIRKGLQLLSQSDLTPKQKTTARSCLMKRGKKHGIKIGESGFDGEMFVLSPMSAFNDDIPEEISTFMESLVKERRDDLYPVLVGIEGQRSQNPFTGEKYTISSEFFESSYKKYKGKFFYPGHSRKFDVAASVAIIEDSQIRKINVKGKDLIAMVHFIKPRGFSAMQDIENGFYSHVSIDAFNLKFSADDPLLVVDGEPLGVAFVIPIPQLKGCPVCKVAHKLGSSCFISESSSDISKNGMSEDNKNKEVIEVTEEQDKKKEGESQKSSVDTPPTSSGGKGVSTNEQPYVDMEARSRIEFLENKDALSAMAKKADVELEALMPIISSQGTVKDRLKSLQSLVIKVEADKKKILESKITEDKKKGSSGTDSEKGTGDGDSYSESQFKKDFAELNGVAGSSFLDNIEETKDEKVKEETKED